MGSFELLIAGLVAITLLGFVFGFRPSRRAVDWFAGGVAGVVPVDGGRRLYSHSRFGGTNSVRDADLSGAEGSFPVLRRLGGPAIGHSAISLHGPARPRDNRTLGMSFESGSTGRRTSTSAT